MTGQPRRVETMSELDAVVVQPNIHLACGERDPRHLIALRRGNMVHVRNVRRDPRTGITVLHMARTYYGVIRPGKPIPHRSCGIGLHRLNAAGFREHRMPFRIDHPLPDVVIDASEPDFNRWWRRSFYPGCDRWGLLKASRKLTEREILIREYYDVMGERWTPPRIRKLARSLGVDIETLCAAVRLPIRLFAWYEELYRDDQCNIPRGPVNLLGSSFLLFDLLNGMRNGDTSKVLFPIAGLRTQTPATINTAGRAA